MTCDRHSGDILDEADFITYTVVTSTPAPIGVEKSVTPTTQVEYGDELTYTLVISAAPGTQVGLYDPLTNTTFARFVEQPPGVSHAGGVIAGMLTVTPTNQVTVSFVAEVGTPDTGGWTLTVTNRACVYSSGGTLGSCIWSDPVTNLARNPDYDNLYESLQIVSTGWVQEHVDQANQILMKTIYTADDWEEFFAEYFSENPFTDDLRNYLGYPVFWWFSDEAHLNLQLGLMEPLAANVETIVSDHNADLGSALDADPNLRQTMFNSQRFLNDMVRVGIIDESAKTQIYNFYTQHIEAYPQLWKKTVTLDIVAQPYVATVRAQMYMNLGDALPLTSDHKNEIAQTIALTSTCLTIWTNYSVLVVDNNGLDESQLDVISIYLGEVPATLHNLHYISVNSLLGNEGDRYQWFVNSAGVNIFDIPVGGGMVGNEFPDDVEPKYAASFSLVLAHEVNHVVDAYFSNNDPSLADRKDDLIEAAGDSHMNYLRSMFEDGFFTTYPQEFFASIANQWFADSAHTLELGLVRWENGYREPINQFLFFAEVYAQEGDEVPFYTIDEQGTLTRTMVLVQRDSNNHINRLTVDGETHRFALDGDGNVVAVLTHAIHLPVVMRQY